MDIGCGENKRCDIGVDIRKLKSVDIVCDVKFLPFRGDCFERTFSSHVLEHFSWREVPDVLEEWARVTKPNGTFEILVPNLRSFNVFKTLLFNRVELDRKEYGLGIIWGSQQHVYDVHKCGFTAKLLKSLLDRNGIYSEVVGEKQEDYLIGLPFSGKQPIKEFYRRTGIGKLISKIFPSWGIQVHLVGRKTQDR